MEGTFAASEIFQRISPFSPHLPIYTIVSATQFDNIIFLGIQFLSYTQIACNMLTRMHSMQILLTEILK